MGQPGGPRRSPPPTCRPPSPARSRSWSNARCTSTSPGRPFDAGHDSAGVTRRVHRVVPRRRRHRRLLRPVRADREPERRRGRGHGHLPAAGRHDGPAGATCVAAQEPVHRLGRPAPTRAWPTPTCRRRSDPTNGVPDRRRTRDVVAGDAALDRGAQLRRASTATGPRWALAEGEDGGRFDTLAPTSWSPTPRLARARADVTVFVEGGGDLHAERRRWRPTAARPSPCAIAFPEAGTAASRRSSRASAPTPLDLVVERAMYSNAGRRRVGGRHRRARHPAARRRASTARWASACPVVTVTATDAAARETGSDTGDASRSTATGDLVGRLVVTYALGGTASAPGLSRRCRARSSFAAGVDDDDRHGDAARRCGRRVAGDADAVPVSPARSYAVGTPATAQVVVTDNDQANVVGARRAVRRRALPDAGHVRPDHGRDRARAGDGLRGVARRAVRAAAEFVPRLPRRA